MNRFNSRIEKKYWQYQDLNYCFWAGNHWNRSEVYTLVIAVVCVLQKRAKRYQASAHNTSVSVSVHTILNLILGYDPALAIQQNMAVVNVVCYLNSHTDSYSRTTYRDEVSILTLHNKWTKHSIICSSLKPKASWSRLGLERKGLVYIPDTICYDGLKSWACWA